MSRWPGVQGRTRPSPASGRALLRRASYDLPPSDKPGLDLRFGPVRVEVVPGPAIRLVDIPEQSTGREELSDPVSPVAIVRTGFERYKALPPNDGDKFTFRIFTPNHAF